MYDLIIIGGGPAGVSAGIYAARKKMKTLLVTDGLGGQSVVSADIQNWVGTISISGLDLAKNLEAHLRAQQDIEIIDDDRVTAVQKKEDGSFRSRRRMEKHSRRNICSSFREAAAKNWAFREKRHSKGGASFIALFATHRFLEARRSWSWAVETPQLESVMDLVPYAAKIYLLVRSEILKGDPITQEKVRKEPKASIIWNGVTQEILGKDFVTGIRYQDIKSQEIKELPVDGVFVDVGLVPNSDFVKDLVERDPYGCR